MPFALDAQLQAELTAALTTGAFTPPQPADRDDWKTLRANTESLLATLGATMPAHPEIVRQDYQITSFDDVEVLARWYTPANKGADGPGPAAVYLHGGGMVVGSVELHDRSTARYVADSGVPLLAIDYRLAPEHPHPAPVQDCFAGLTWLREHADELDVDPARIGLMGESAGGGLAAGVALLARDRDVPVAKQILIYPMLDDRTTEPDPALVPLAFWSYNDNYTGWHALLGDAVGGVDVSEYAAPARARDLTGVAPAYVEVGELDIFRDECITYARRMADAGTSIELYVRPGCPHGFEVMSREADVVQRSRADRLRALASL